MVKRRDSNLKYFVTAGMVLGTILRAAYSEGVQDFVFRYLSVGLNISIILSMLYHGNDNQGPHRDDAEYAQATLFELSRPS